MPGVQRATWGIAVQSLANNERLFDLNARTLMVPASVAKLVSLATAVDAVGWDYRFTTTLRAGGPVTDASSKPPVNPLAPAEPASDEGNGCSMARSASRGHAPFYAITTLALFLLRRYRRRSVAGLSRSETTLSTSNRIRKHPSAVPTNEVLRASRS